MEITTPSPLPPAEVGARYSVVLQVTGGTTPYRWKCEPGLPQGLALDEGTGEIAGVPRRAEALNTRHFTVSDSSGEAGRYLDLIVRREGLVILTTELPAATLGQNYDQSLLASGGRGRYSWSLVPGSSLPAGLALEADGTIAGKATAVTPDPPGSFKVEVKDASQPPLTARRPLGLAVNPAPLRLKTTVLPNAKALTAYKATLEAEGGIGPLTWMVGPLPPGLTLAPGGVITGTPTEPTTGGPARIAVSVRGARGESADEDLSLTVEAPPPPPPPPPLFTPPTHNEVPPAGVSRDLSDTDAADLPPLARPEPAPANQRLLGFLARLATRPESFAGYVREPRAATAAASLDSEDREALLAGSMDEIWAALHRPPTTGSGGDEDGGAEARTGSGSLIVVGTGIKTAGQLTVEAIASIAASDHVLYSVADPVAEAAIRELNGSATSISGYYEEGRWRDETYEAMVRHVVECVRRGQATCLALYGHPGVFAYPAHEAIRRLRDEGYPARMLPGISAEDCLFADLGVDPATAGCQSYEATGFLAHWHSIDVTSHLLLWQAGVVGDPTFSRLDRDAVKLPELASRLSGLYGPLHKAITYEAAILPGPPARISRVAVGALSVDTVTAGTTLYVPPKDGPGEPEPDDQRR